jgi:hypothetical protein
MATALKRTVYTRTSGAAVPAVREAADPALQRFLDAVWLERGLSANTLAAYRADLTALARWLEERDSASKYWDSSQRGSRADRGPDRLRGSCRVFAAFFVSWCARV